MDLTNFFNDENGNGKRYEQSPFKEKGNCLVCGRKISWHCRVTENEGLAYCKYVPSDKTDGLGRYQHILKRGHQQPVSPIKAEDKKTIEVEKANSDKLNEVYTAFLKSLELNQTHRENLRDKRGLSDEIIDRNLYRSVPSYQQRFEVAEKLSESYDLKGVPGFYLENGKWALNCTYSGFYVPYRDVEGCISGLQIRKDGECKPKYIWLSSANKEKGSSSGSPLHIVNANLIKEGNEIFITEGALKADIIGDLYNVGIIATAGVNTWKSENLINSIIKDFPDIERFVLVFDADWESNSAVKNALSNLIMELKKSFFSVFVLTWDKSFGKGFDDVLRNLDWQNNELSEIPFKYIKADIFESEFLKINAVKANIEEASDFPNKEIISENNEIIFHPEVANDNLDKLFGISCGDFLDLELPDCERVIFGLGRGNLGLMVASTNLGKTTLALNLSLSICMSRKFQPLFNQNYAARKVLYIDGESTLSDLQSDIKKMIESCDKSDQELIRSNLNFICDYDLNDEPLDLANLEHLSIVQKKTLELKPDLIIVDTLSALTNLEDENDNAKIKKEIIQPLKNLAKQTNSGVLLLHHSGKFSEGSGNAVEGAYKGRGASALGALSRVVLNLNKGQKEFKGKVILSCSKVKGESFNPAVLELDVSTRWFKPTNEKVAQTLSTSDQNYEKVVKFVKNSKRKSRRKEIIKAFEDQPGLSEAQIGRFLTQAVKNKDLLKTYGYYFSPDLPKNEIKANDNVLKNLNLIFCKPNQELSMPN